MSLLVRTNRTKLQQALATGPGVVELAEVSDVASGGLLDVGAPEDAVVVDGDAVTPAADDRANYVTIGVMIEDDGAGQASAHVELVTVTGSASEIVDVFGGILPASGALTGSLHALVPEGSDYRVDIEGDAEIDIIFAVEQALG